MLLAPDVLSLLAEALPRAFNGAGLTETQFQAFYDVSAAPCRTPVLSPNLELDTLNLNMCLGARLDVDFATFCAAYDTYVEDGIIRKTSLFRNPWDYFIEVFALGNYEARFYFMSPRVGAQYNRPFHLRAILMILAQFAVVNYEGEVVRQDGSGFVVQARGRRFGFEDALPVTSLTGAEKEPMMLRYGVARYWQARPYFKAKPEVADGAYRVVADMAIAPELKMPILEGISIMRWMADKGTFHEMMLDINATPEADAASRKACKLRAVEHAMHFSWFSNVVAELGELLSPVLSPREFVKLFGRASYANGSEIPSAVVERWTKHLTELHRSISDAE